MEDKKNEWLRSAREKIFSSQREMARHIGLSFSLYSMLERGERNITKKYIDRICERTDISRSYLETGRGPMLKSDKDQTLYDLIMSLDDEDKIMMIGMAKRLLEAEKDK